MVLGEEHFYLFLFIVAQFFQLFVDEPFEEHLFLDPDRHRRQERAYAFGGKCIIGFEQSFEFQQRLVVENDRIELVD